MKLYQQLNNQHKTEGVVNIEKKKMGNIVRRIYTWKSILILQ